MAEFGGELMPIYKVSIYEEYLTRDTVFLNMYDQEMFRLSPEKDYDPFLWAKERFSIESESELDDFHRWIFDPAHLAVELTLLPESFYPVYKEVQAELAAAEAAVASASRTPVPEPDGIAVRITAAPAETTAQVVATDDLLMMATASSVPPPPGGGGSTNSASGGSSNLIVTLNITLPDENFGHMGHIEIFSKEDLILNSDWTPTDDWVPTYGSSTVEWTDPASSNKTQRFYLVADAADTDGDGRSDLYEASTGTDSNTFNVVNLNTNEYNDWLEIKIFGGLLSTNDFDGDGLLNTEELVCATPTSPAVMISDPALADSDNEGLNDYQERRVWHTAPMDPDTDDDGIDDAAEVLGSPRTDPHNPDTTAPLVSFFGN